MTTDDLLREHPERVPLRPLIGLQPKITDAELITLAVMQACWATPANAAGCATV